jgi:drug/metabolite transporter (DMT)-like permease
VALHSRLEDTAVDLDLKPPIVSRTPPHTVNPFPPTESRIGFAVLLPAIIAATSFGCADVLTKLTLQSGADVLTTALFRGIIGLPLMTAWLMLGTRPIPLTPRTNFYALGVGVLFASNVYWLFRSLEVVEVPIAILTYFTYPLMTGLAAVALGLETLNRGGVLAALAAFGGLALMIGAHPAGLAPAGILFALAGAVSRVIILLIIRARLAGADARLITWYSLAAATAVFALAALASGVWQPPQTPLGWSALIGSSVAMTIAILAVFIATVRIGPFRSAMFMNLEPMVATIGSALVLGEVITPLQTLGAVVMIAALVAFQARR